jgi:hypothetical protein
MHMLTLLTCWKLASETNDDEKDVNEEEEGQDSMGMHR